VKSRPRKSRVFREESDSEGQEKGKGTYTLDKGGKKCLKGKSRSWGLEAGTSISAKKSRIGEKRRRACELQKKKCSSRGKTSEEGEKSEGRHEKSPLKEQAES